MDPDLEAELDLLVAEEESDPDSLLRRAAGKGDLEAMKSLLEAGANIDGQDHTGWAPLHSAAGHDQVEAMRFLLESGANIEIRTNFWETPLHRACKRMDLESIKLLLDSGANIEAENRQTETPYQVAFAECHMEVVAFLKSRGAQDDNFHHRDDFEIFRDEPLGQGGFGTVYKARDMKRGRYVAVKVCQATDSARSDLKKESTLLQTLKDTSIVQHIFYHFDEERQEHQVFMELHGGSLASKIIETGPMSEHDVHGYLQYILWGLAYLHEKGVIHRDLKPGNVLVGETWYGSTKLADFGCSTSLMQQGGTITTEYVEGTAPYRAPEVFRGEYSEGSDLWAVACCVVEMATAKKPWAETNKVGKELERHIRTSNSQLTSNSHPKIPDHLTPELKQILAKMFHQDPQQRGTAEELMTTEYLDNDFEEVEASHTAGVGSSTGEDDTTSCLLHYGDGQTTATDTVQIVPRDE